MLEYYVENILSCACEVDGGWTGKEIFGGSRNVVFVESVGVVSINRGIGEAVLLETAGSRGIIGAIGHGQSELIGRVGGGWACDTWQVWWQKEYLEVSAWR